MVDNDVSREALVALMDGGIVGVAFNPAMEGVEVVTGAGALLDMLADLDMFAQIQVVGDQLVELMPTIERIRTRVLIDHCGRPEVAGERTSRGFRHCCVSRTAGARWSSYRAGRRFRNRIIRMRMCSLT